MLAVVNTLQELQSVLLGHPAVVARADHMNPAHDTAAFKTARVMNWRLAVKEFAPSLH